MRFLAVLLAFAAGPLWAQDAALGEDVFQSHCAVCHGDEGLGNGPLAKALTVPPPDLTVLSAMNGDIFPTRFVLERIDGTDPLISHGGPMPVFNQILQGPLVVTDTAEGDEIALPELLVDLIAWLESVQR